VIDDANDARIGWHLNRVEGKARFLASDKKDRLTHAGTNGINGN
jgi:hypothetical protein